MKIFSKKSNLLIFCFIMLLILVPVTLAIAPGGGGGSGGEGGGSGYYYYVHGDVLDRHDDPVYGADATVIGVYGEEKTDETDSSGRFVTCFIYSTGGLKSFIVEVTYSDWALERVVVSMYPGLPDPTIIHMGPDYYAVLVGISDDDDSQLCDNSILLWYEFLTTTGMDFDPNNIKVYGTDETGNDYPYGTLLATKDNVKNGLSWMYSNADADDVAFFVYCGHGNKNADGHYFALLPTYTYPNGRLYNYTLTAYIQSSQAERIYCSIDCCYAGGFGPGIRDNPLNGDRTYTVTSTDADTAARGVDVETWTWTPWTKHYLYALWQQSSNPDTAFLEILFDTVYYNIQYDTNINYLPEEYDGNTGTSFSIRG